MYRAAFFIVLSALMASNAIGQSFWKRASESQFAVRSADSRSIIPDKFQSFTLDIEGMKKYLARAPFESAGVRGEKGLHLDIPMSDGTLEAFAVFESPVMQEQLSAKYPAIRSYIATSISNTGRHMRFDISVNGFHAAIFSPDGEKYIDPYSSESVTDYIVYNVKDHNPDTYKGVDLCGFEDHGDRPVRSSGDHNRTDLVELRTYRVAMACTGEWGTKRGTVEKCLADINTMMNRMNLIYEREMAMRFTLINDNDKLIFLNPDTDPYVNSDEGKKLVGINTSKINALIPSTSYDIGHVLSVCFDIGGVAQRGSACQSNKGNGVTCNNNNDLSSIVTRVMAHEVGHQLDASHTWNICTSAADQRAPETAYEPGSGTTIMSYAGSCGTDNVSGDNDDYFHVGSLDQMYAKTTGGGNAYSCADKSNNGNHYPAVTMPVETYFIPISTPFELSATATDEDGDQLTYCWEQYDAGELVTLGSMSSTAPLFRSFKPSATGDVRFFPKASNILSGNLTDKTEVLPTLSRNLNFRFTVRDNHAGGAGVVWRDYQIKSTAQAGPFRVTYPEIDTKFQIGQRVTVTWDVANTDQAPVNCKKVNIYGSFSAALRNDDPNLLPLALSVPNDGSEDIYIPNKTSNFFRIVVKADDNIFLSSSKLPSKIEQPTSPGIYFESVSNNVTICQPDQGNIQFTTQGLAGFADKISFEIVSGVPAGAVASFSNVSVQAGDNVSLLINSTGVVNDQTGNILVRAIAPGIDTMERYVHVHIIGTDLSGISALNPANGSSGVGALPAFSWSEKLDADDYELQVSTSPDFAAQNIVYQAVTTSQASTSTSILDKSTIYYWRVRARNTCRPGDWTPVQAFITEALSCKLYQSGTQSINISASGSPIVELPVQVFDSGNAADINIKLIKADHSRLVDLVAYLVAPSSKEVLLWSRKCGTQQNLNVGLDDQSPLFFQCPISTGKIYRPENPLSGLNGESINGTWKLRLEDKQSGSGGRLQEFNFEICSNVALSNPYLVRNDTLRIHPGNSRSITDALLFAADNNSSADQLIFTIVEVPASGMLMVNGNVAGPGTKLTQSEINTAKLVFDDTSAAEGNDYFSFTVTDGEGGWISITRFNILRDFDVVNSVSDTDIASDVFVSPNPSEGLATIYLAGKAAGYDSFAVADIAGRLRMSGLITGQKKEIDLTGFEKGVYFITLTDGKSRISKKLVKL